MSGTSVRKTSVSAEAVTPAGLARAAQIAELRSKMEQISGEIPHVPVGEGVLELGGQLRALFPGGGLPRQSVTHMSDTPGLVVELLRHVTEAGGYAGVVGWPELSYAALPPESLERVIAVPDPGVDPLGVAAVLVEGLDVVVCHSPVALQLSPVRARPVLGKLRKGRAALMLVGVTVPSPALKVTGEVLAFHGIGRGAGRIVGMDVRVRVSSKSMHPASDVVTVGEAAAPRALRAVR